MPCYRPLTGYRRKDGALTWNRDYAYNCKPITVRCGQCTGCRLERSLQWAVRIMHESRSHQTNSYLTLTYRDEDLPGPYSVTTIDKFKKRVTKNYAENSVKTSDFQDFMKKLRRSEERLAASLSKPYSPIRYFHCGEYGDETLRPHYHAVLFGRDFKTGSKPWKVIKGFPTWTNARLNGIWGHGRVVIGSLTIESAQYVARYIMKKVNGERQADWYGGRKPEYVTMSRRPGLGQKWYDEFKGEVYPRDEVVVKGKLRLPPKYYDYLLDKEQPELLAMLKDDRAAAANAWTETPENLERREKTIKYRIAQYKRNSI